MAQVNVGLEHHLQVEVVSSGDGTGQIRVRGGPGRIACNDCRGAGLLVAKDDDGDPVCTGVGQVFQRVIGFRSRKLPSSPCGVVEAFLEALGGLGDRGPLWTASAEQEQRYAEDELGLLIHGGAIIAYWRYWSVVEMSPV